MKFPYYIIGLFLLGGINFTAYSQDNSATDEMPNSQNKTVISEAAGEGQQTLFSKRLSDSKRQGCSLVQNKWKERKIYNYKNGYKIVTDQEDEIITVKHGGNATKVKYMNDYETLDYHVKKNGKVHYSYTYINGCMKVKFNRDKNGITSLTNTSDLTTDEVRENIRRVMQVGVRSCASYGKS